MDNMNKAIETVSNELDLDIRKYTVTGMSYQGHFVHQWYIGPNTEMDVDVDRLTHLLDTTWLH